MTSNTDLIKELKDKTSAEIHFDPIHLRAYSVDASIYEIEPIGVVVPKTKQDLIQTVKIASSHQIPVIPRGAATGITGACLGRGLIIDTSKYLNHILKIDYEREYAVCEPGVVQDFLNQALAPHGYRLGPDTSTGDRATLGGMMANNSAGARSLLYGKMVDHVEAVELILYTGEILYFQAIDDDTWKAKRKQQDHEGQIYREIYRIRNTYREEIEDHFPKIPRRASGYNLDELIKPYPLNIAKLITGSEGTLGIATEITLKISKKPQFLGLCIVHFDEINEGMHTIPEMLQHHPIALEMIDDQIMRMARLSPSVKGKLEWLKNTPKMVFVAEFAGNSTEDVLNKLAAFEADMIHKKIGYHTIKLTDPQKMNHVWEVRKAGLGLLLSRRTYSRAIAFIEDFSLSPDQLPSFMEKFQRYLQSVNKEAGIYGHVGPGCMHVRPYIDLRKKEELILMQKMMDDVSTLILEHHGSMSGEHGDGILRTWLNKKMFGEHIYQAFVELKAVFDPKNLMNPGKMVHGQSLLENLRIDPDTKINPVQTYLNFNREGGFELAVDLCNGNGFCRKKSTLMCPSFQASGDEYDTTRARAQALRAAIHGKLSNNGMTSREIYDVLDLCLECKGCKTECPSQVDMAKMKAEFLYHYQEKHGYSLRNRLFGHLAKLNQIASYFPSFYNWIIRSKLSKWILQQIGISPKRPLPLLAKQRFSHWFNLQTQSEEQKETVVLFNDTYSEFYCPEIGQAAFMILQKLGYKVIVPPWTCCGRPLISKGMLRQAKHRALTLINLLFPYSQKGIKIIGLEPSCLLTIKDDFQDLLGQKEFEMVENVMKACTSFDEFLSSHLQDGRLPLPLKDESHVFKLHGHCHQKSLIGMSPTLQVLRSLPGSTVSEINSGCCGLAGSFGYEQEHHDFSMKIGELVLFPTIRSSPKGTIIVADGFSCRAQIQHGTSYTAKHLAEVIADSLY